MARPDGWSGLFAKAFAHSRNPMALVDDKRVYVDVNGAFVKLVGCRRDALVGHHLWDFVGWRAARLAGRVEQGVAGG